MTLADAIAASTPAATSNSYRKSAGNAGAAVGTNSTDRPRINSPAFQAYEDKKNAYDAKIADIRARIDGIYNGYSVTGGENLSEKNKKLRGDLIEKIKGLRAELKTLDDERRTLSNQFSETLETLKKKNADVNAAKDKMSFKTTGEIDARIHEIESTLEGGRFTLSEERQMLQEVTKLRKMRKALETMDGTTGNDVTSLRFRLDQIKLRQGDIEARITGKRDEVNKVNAEIDALNGVHIAEKNKRADTKTEIESLKKEIEALYAKKKEAWDEFVQVKAAKEAAYHRIIARREEQDRVTAIESEIDELERKLGHLTSESVIDKKWNECNNLINFFAPYISKDTITTVGDSESKPKAAAVARNTTVDLSKVQILKKEDECYFVPSKAKKQQKVAATDEPVSELNKLPFHILAALADMTLPIPKSVEKDLPSLLETLQARRADLQSHRDASIADMENKRNAIIRDIETLRAKIDDKEEQITAAVVKKAEKAAAAASAESGASEPVDEDVCDVAVVTVVSAVIVTAESVVEVEVDSTVQSDPEN